MIELRRGNESFFERIVIVFANLFWRISYLRIYSCIRGLDYEKVKKNMEKVCRS